MRFQKQKFLHDPENEIYGDCWRTVIACVLDLDAEDVPHFMHPDGGGDEASHQWLEERGLFLIRTSYDGGEPLENVLAAASSATVKPVFYLLSGFSKTGCNHVVIAKGAEIVWDPSLKDAGIVGPMDNGLWYVEWIVRAP